jgi:hypothetical protein
MKNRIYGRSGTMTGIDERLNNGMLELSDLFNGRIP